MRVKDDKVYARQHKQDELEAEKMLPYISGRDQKRKTPVTIMSAKPPHPRLTNENVSDTDISASKHP